MDREMSNSIEQSETMRAAVIDRYGPASVLRMADIARPAPGENEVAIRIAATVATPSDVAFRSAKPFIVRLFAGLTRPKYITIGTSFAGTIESAGAAVTRYAPGQRVYGPSDLDCGTYAEFKCLNEGAAFALIPEGTSFEDAVALSEGFLTAMPFLRDVAHLERGQRILINGASGSIGTVAVQLAKHMGAHVSGVCSTANLDLVASLGADAVIDYTKEDFTVRQGAYDVIFDAVGKWSFGRCRKALTASGIYMTTVPTFSILIDMLRTRGSTGQRAALATTGLRPAAEKAKDLLVLNGLMAEGKLRAVIDRRYPLEEIADAHRYIETGRKRGSVVITVG